MNLFVVGWGPDDALVVIAGRHPPGSRWLADPAWRDLLRVVCREPWKTTLLVGLITTTVTYYPRWKHHAAM